VKKMAWLLSNLLLIQPALKPVMPVSQSRVAFDIFEMRINPALPVAAEVRGVSQRFYSP
jgi:hypothetical protein